MPHRPTVSSLNANSVGIINAIRNNASQDYYQAVPAAIETDESIRNIGKEICAFQPRMNEFINALVNRIALVIVTSHMYTNPWAAFKKGVLDFGETVEEIFVDIATVHPFDPEDAEQTVFRRTFPDVNSMFHAMNMQVQYPVTISQAELRQAFTSLNGVTDLIARIVESLYSAANYDEFIMMKYLIARLALDGSLPVEPITAVTDEATAKSAIKVMKSSATKFGFMSNNYTIAGNRNFVDNNDIYVITTADFDAETDVDVLAKAYNMDRTNWLGRHITVDSFSFNAGELERLDLMLEKDTGYQAHKLTAQDLENLAKITAIAMDAKFFQIYDNLNEFAEMYNGKGLYWNYFYHVWRTYSASPFVNVLMYAEVTPTVTSVTVNGATSATAGTTNVYTATVVASNFANKGVTWTLETTNGTGDVHIDQLGRVTIPAGATGTWTVKATSIADTSKNGTKAFTIA